MAVCAPISDRVAAIRGLLRSPGWSPERLRAYQAERLRRIAAYASVNIPFYHASFRNAGVDPNGLRTPEDIARLPVIGKSDIQHDSAAFLPRGVSRDELVWVKTSGSTGEPMHVCRTMFEERLLQAFRIRAEMSLGMRLTDRRALVVHTGVPRNALRMPKPTLLSRFGMLGRFLHDISRPPDEIIRFLRNVRPHIIAGYPGTLAVVASEMTDADRSAIRPRFIVTGAESLRPHVRKGIEEGFHSRVYDFYGAHECNLVGWECGEQNGFHLNEDNVLVEVLRDGRPAEPGEEGEVVITTLHSYAMPFLRYRLGDIAVRGRANCACGLPFSMLRTIHGRSAEVAVGSDGTEVPAIPIEQVFLAHSAWIARFQIVQTKPGVLRVYIVARPGASQSEPGPLALQVERVSGMQVWIEFVEELPHRPSGKMPTFVSRAPAD